MQVKKISGLILLTVVACCMTIAACGGGGVGTVTSVSAATWVHQAYLKALNNFNGYLFGNSVSISGDTIVVGAKSEASTTTAIINGTDLSSTDNGGDDNGAAYVFVRSGKTWSHQAYLKAPNNSNGDGFGNSVSISGDTVVVGAEGESSTTTAIVNGTNLSSTDNNGNDNGAAYVFVRSGSTWTHQAYLKAPNNSNGDQFGSSVSISGDTVVVGAEGESGTTTAIVNGTNLSSTNNNGNDNGAVYVFVRSGSTWTHQAYLKAPNNSNSDRFGASLAISGNTIVIGAASESSTTTAIIHGADLGTTNNSGSQNGAAYVFVRSGSTWTHQAYLKAPNNSNSDRFGSSVSISGDTIVVGAEGESSTTTAVINGANLNATDNSGDDNGAAYVFVRSGSTWTHQAYLKAPNNSNSDRFGSAVSISGDTVVVGAALEKSTTKAIIDGSNLNSTNNSGNDNGAVYVFVRSGSTWKHQTYLKAPNNSNFDYFGRSVAVSGDTVVVGAEGEASTTTSVINGTSLSATNDGGDQNGAAYVFAR